MLIFFRYPVNHAHFFGSLPRCDVGRGRSPRCVQRTTPWLVSVGHVTHLDQSGQNATSKETAAVEKRPSVTLRHELCCVVTSCCLEDEGKVSGVIVRPRAAPQHAAARSELKDGAGWLIGTPEARRAHSDAITYITGGIDKTQSVITD